MAVTPDDDRPIFLTWALRVVWGLLGVVCAVSFGTAICVARDNAHANAGGLYAPMVQPTWQNIASAPADDAGSIWFGPFPTADAGMRDPYAYLSTRAVAPTTVIVYHHGRGLFEFNEADPTAIHVLPAGRPPVCERFDSCVFMYWRTDDDGGTP